MRRRAFVRLAMAMAASALFDVTWPEPEPVTDLEVVGRLVDELMRDGRVWEEIVESCRVDAAIMRRIPIKNYPEVAGRNFSFPVSFG
ncbi:MAG: hypothetical protein KAJ19_21770 [Gammaproteobacteria bacterium]|nr:hypothetical protein [Gammaproteobacteria bacterium]